MRNMQSHLPRKCTAIEEYQNSNKNYLSSTPPWPGIRDPKFFLVQIILAHIFWLTIPDLLLVVTFLTCCKLSWSHCKRIRPWVQGCLQKGWWRRSGWGRGRGGQGRGRVGQTEEGRGLGWGQMSGRGGTVGTEGQDLRWVLKRRKYMNLDAPYLLKPGHGILKRQKVIESWPLFLIQYYPQINQFCNEEFVLTGHTILSSKCTLWWSRGLPIGK